jgi:tRNA (cmo5U34)-methyltransferase
VAGDTDADASGWKSGHHVAAWLAAGESREQRRGLQRRLLADLLPFGEDERFVFVDLGAGTGAAARAVLDRYPGASAVLADFSPLMAEEGTRALEPYRGRFGYVELDLAGAPWPAEIPDPVDAVISSMTLHHLPDPSKEQLLTEVFTRLAPGGWFLDFDLVAAGDPVVEAAWRRAEGRLDPEAAAERRERTLEEPERLEHHTRHVSPLAPQLDVLRSVGFEGVDVYWKQLSSVVIGGRRPATGS